MKTLSIIGSVDAVPEYRKVQGKPPLLLARISIHEPARAGGVDSVLLVDVILTDKRAVDLAPKLKLGDLIASSGQLTLRPYEGRSGSKVRLEIRASHFRIISPGGGGGGPVASRDVPE